MFAASISPRYVPCICFQDELSPALNELVENLFHIRRWLKLMMLLANLEQHTVIGPGDGDWLTTLLNCSIARWWQLLLCRTRTGTALRSGRLVIRRWARCVFVNMRMSITSLGSILINCCPEPFRSRCWSDSVQNSTSVAVRRDFEGIIACDIGEEKVNVYVWPSQHTIAFFFLYIFEVS